MSSNCEGISKFFSWKFIKGGCFCVCFSLWYSSNFNGQIWTLKWFMPISLPAMAKLQSPLSRRQKRSELLQVQANDPVCLSVSRRLDIGAWLALDFYASRSLRTTRVPLVDWHIWFQSIINTVAINLFFVNHQLRFLYLIVYKSHYLSIFLTKVYYTRPEK